MIIKNIIYITLFFFSIPLICFSDIYQKKELKGIIIDVNRSIMKIEIENNKKIIVEAVRIAGAYKFYPVILTIIFDHQNNIIEIKNIILDHDKIKKELKEILSK